MKIQYNFDPIIHTKPKKDTLLMDLIVYCVLLGITVGFVLTI